MGELDLIKWIRKHSNKKKPVLIGIGDDSAVIDVKDADSITVSTDTLLDGTHFNSAQSSPKQIGCKSITSSISDIAAMGCRPSFVLVSISFPAKEKIDFCKKIFKGIFETAAKYNVQLIGGDIVSGKTPLTINVTTIGIVQGRNPIKRYGARQEDVIMVTGKLGGSILSKHLKFTPRIDEGVLLNQEFKINSMIDISDGLLTDLNHILDESGLGAVIDERLIPISKDAVKLSGMTKKSPLFHALTDGEDYELIFTASKTTAKKILESPKFKIPITAIGRVKKRKGLFAIDAAGIERPVKPMGYEHMV